MKFENIRRLVLKYFFFVNYKMEFYYNCIVDAFKGVYLFRKVNGFLLVIG